MPDQYNQNMLNNFVNRQGGTLQNLGASPTYTGAPAMRGTPPNPYMNMNQNPYNMMQPPPGYQPMPDGRPIPEAVMGPGRPSPRGMQRRPGILPRGQGLSSMMSRNMSRAAAPQRPSRMAQRSNRMTQVPRRRSNLGMYMNPRRR